MPGSIGCGLGAVGRASLIEDTGHVVHYGPQADHQLFRDITVTLAKGHKAEYLHLSLAQAVGIGGYEIPRLGLLPKGGCTLSERPHAQLVGDGQRLVQQGHRLLTVAGILEQDVGVVVASPSLLGLAASLAAEGKGILKVHHRLVEPVLCC
jgi:hypothetical protein